MPRGRFTDAQVLRIRKQASEGVVYSEIAEKNESTVTHISSIARGKFYKDVGGPRTHRRDKRKAGAAAANGCPDLAALPIDDAARLLQALAVEWPKIRDSFLLIDRLFRRQAP